MTYIIYKHTNKINGKAYIGFTSKSIDDRWNRHCKDARRGSTNVFHKAIRKYGKDAFDHEVIEECSTEEQALQQEKHWTLEFNDYVSNPCNHPCFLHDKNHLDEEYEVQVVGL